MAKIEKIKMKKISHLLFCGTFAVAALALAACGKASFHVEGMDNPDNPCSVVLTDEQLLEYLDSVEKKTLDYLDTLTDDMLYEKPENCRFTRMELVLRQFRHISFHTGMLNGQTALATGQFPMWVSETSKYVDDGIFFGRYRKGKVQP